MMIDKDLPELHRKWKAAQRAWAAHDHRPPHHPSPHIPPVAASHLQPATPMTAAIKCTLDQLVGRSIGPDIPSFIAELDRIVAHAGGAVNGRPIKRAIVRVETTSGHTLHGAALIYLDTLAAP